MVILLRRNRSRLLALLMAATAAGILWTAHRDAAAASAAAPARAADGWTIVLDAGHGGEDGGAVSRGGVPESGDRFAYDDLDVLVVKVDHHRIEELRVTQRPHAGEKVETALIGEMVHG